MNSQDMLTQLEDLAQRMTINVRYERCRSRGGLCRLKDEQMIIIRKDLTVPEKVDILSTALCRFPLEDYYMMPEVRTVLEKALLAGQHDKGDDSAGEDELNAELADLG